MSEPQKQFSFTELIVTIAVIVVVFALLTSIAVPGGSFLQAKAPETKALSNAKQIALACANYAVDNNGRYPGFAVANGTNAKTEIPDYSNTAFNLLFPDYLTTAQVFYERQSAWTPRPTTDPSVADMQAGKSLPAGYNEWAYVVGLSNTSTATFPMIADGFADLKRHAYTKDQTARGGVWKGYNAVVVFCDTSAKVMRCNEAYQVIGTVTPDEFDTTGHPGWMNSAGPNGQHVLNPK